MLKKYDGVDKQLLVEYIGDNYNKCLYLYLNFMKYDNNNPNVKTWYEIEFNKIKCIVLKYFNGMHIFSKDNDYNIENIIDIIKEEKPSNISGERKTISKIEEQVKLLSYVSEYGWVRCMDTPFPFESNEVKIASIEDIHEIAELVIKDKDISNSYSFDQLYNQIRVRNLEAYGRNYIIKINGRIVTHASTGAENDKVSVLSYVMTDEKNRGKGLATKVCSKLCNDLLREGKKVYLINYTNESTKLYDKIGFKVVDEWTKMYRKEEL